MSHKKYRTETNCLNCGAEVKGPFCQECGQENLETHENFFHLAGHFISDYFHFDSKFFRSLIPLFIRPGFLTRQYWDGKRVSYIHPLRLFFFVTILFVLSSSLFYKHYEKEMRINLMSQDSSRFSYTDNQLASLNDSVKLSVGKGDSLTVKQIKIEKEREASQSRMQRKLNVGTADVFKSIKYITFLLLPVYALLFKILYLRRKSFYVDHLVYTMHLQSFMYVLLSVIFILPFLFPLSLTTIRTLSMVILLFYIGFSLHYLYRQVWWKTIIKSVLASFLLAFITGFSIYFIALLDAMFVQ